MSAAPPPRDIGTHCALPSCSSLDFLPLRCSHCASLFCQTHASPSSHACPSDPSLSTLTAEHARRAASERSGPEFKDLLPDPKRHKSIKAGAALSPEEAAKKDKQQAALEKLRAALAKKLPPIGAGGGATVKKVNPALELMKLKQRAKPGDPRHVKREGDVSAVDRLYLTVRLLEGEDGEEKGLKEFWVSRAITAGKALDLFADHFRLNNINNATSDPTKLLSLASPASDPPTRLILSDLLSKQVTNGGSVLLLKGFSWPS
ncbi:hypothetical protein JCM11641_005671 [Rhodosporidiobolus odoratus]